MARVMDLFLDLIFSPQILPSPPHFQSHRTLFYIRYRFK
jgi:hypothetical protein